MPLSDDIEDLIEHETTKAQQLLKGLAEAMPRSVAARLLLATSHLRRLEFETAFTHYREALALDPRNEEALRYGAFCLLAIGDNEGALGAFTQAFKTLSSTGAMRSMGLVLHRLGRTEEAIAHYDRVLTSCKPTSLEIPIALQGIVGALRDAGRPVAADRYLHSLLERFRREPVTVASGLSTRNNSEDFHEWSHYADKSRLAAALTARQAADPAGRFPESFVLPKDRAALERFAAGASAPPLWIVKPIRSSGGQGISVTNDLATAIDRDEVVIQRYIDRPYLIEGRKGHCRIYGLITSADPLRAYVYSEGIVRIAPELYKPTPDEPGGVSMHVTNTALHLDHPDLKISEDPNQEDTGAVRSLSALLRRMTADGLDGAKVFGEIKALMEWFVRMLAADGVFTRQAASPARSFQPKLFGLDVLIDDEGHPWLIEMQRTPAARGQPLVEKINAELYVTVFRMAHGLLIDDATPPEQIAALHAGDEAIRRRELELEIAARGKFVPLDL